MSVQLNKTAPPGEILKVTLEQFFKGFIQDNSKVYYVPHYPIGELQDKYTCFVQQINRQNESVLKKMFFSAKILEFYNDFPLLDKDMFDCLKAYDRAPETFLYYILFTPKCTIVFNLTELESKGRLKWEQSKKVATKTVAVLKVNQGKVFDFINGKKHIQPSSPTPVEMTQPQFTKPEFTQPFVKTQEVEYQEPVRDSLFMNADRSLRKQTPRQPEAFPDDNHEFFKEEDDNVLYKDSDYGITRDDNDQIVLRSGISFKDLPIFIQQEFSDRHLIIQHIPDKELRNTMIKDHGSVSAVAQLIKKQFENKFKK